MVPKFEEMHANVHDKQSVKNIITDINVLRDIYGEAESERDTKYIIEGQEQDKNFPSFLK